MFRAGRKRAGKDRHSVERRFSLRLCICRAAPGSLSEWELSCYRESTPALCASTSSFQTPGAAVQRLVKMCLGVSPGMEISSLRLIQVALLAVGLDAGELWDKQERGYSRGTAVCLQASGMQTLRTPRNKIQGKFKRSKLSDTLIWFLQGNLSKEIVFSVVPGWQALGHRKSIKKRIR